MAFGKILLAGYSGQSRAGKIAPSCPLGQPITARDFVHLARSRSQPYNKFRILTKRESFSCVFMDRDGVEVHEHATKRTRLVSSHLDRTSLANKGFIWKKNMIFLRTLGVILSGPDSVVFPTQIANNSAGSVRLARSRSQSYNYILYCTLAMIFETI